MTYSYIGSELEMFAAATNWKAYFSTLLAPFIEARVLEIGAGFGSNIPYLHTPAVRRWTSVEPDLDLARPITKRVINRELLGTCRVLVGTIESFRKRCPSIPFCTSVLVPVSRVLDNVTAHKFGKSIVAPRAPL
jgi:hypothetical protein